MSVPISPCFDDPGAPGRSVVDRPCAPAPGKARLASVAVLAQAASKAADDGEGPGTGRLDRDGASAERLAADRREAVDWIVCGFVGRMASDRCLPQFLLRRNRFRGTPHNIIFGYFLLSALLVVLLRGDVRDLAGAYSFVFLSVPAIFTVGVCLLKFKRPSLPRDVEASWGGVALAFVMVIIGLLGNLMGNPEVLSVFALYVAAAGALVLAMQHWTRLLHLLLLLCRKVLPALPTDALQQEILDTQRTPVVFFLKQDDVYVLNKAIGNVSANEQTRHLIIVHVYDASRSVPPELAEHVRMIDEMYPRIKVTLLTIEGHFGPPLIEWLSRELEVPKNGMFLTAPDSTFKNKLDSLGGARIITH